MENFSEWFHNILEEAEIIDARYPIKGMSVWLPNGFKIRTNVLKMLRGLLDKDHDEVLFPLLIPETELAKEGIHVKGFEDEVYWITHGGRSELNEKLALRPTSETSIYPMYALWVRSHIDLPMKYYQIVNTFRYETKHTRPLIRVREITTFKEAHTMHASSQEAEKQVEDAMVLYKEFFDKLGVPYLLSKRPVWDKFPGADYTMAFDTIMPDGKTLQIGTIHNLGQTFAKTYDIIFETETGDKEYVYQTCYGISERIIAALISVHGDESGLSLPPAASSEEIVIVPIIFKDGGEEVLAKSREIKELLLESGYRVRIDNRNMRAGKKFYDIELKGTPLRVELGPRDLANNKAVLVRRDTKEKIEVSLDNIRDSVADTLEDITDNMFKKSWNRFEEKIVDVDCLDDVTSAIEDGKVARVSWCGDEECGKAIEEESNLDLLGTGSETSGTCIHCQKEAKYITYIAKTY